MTTEQTFYSDDKGVRITGTRAIFGSTTYSMANITSVTKGQEPAKRTPGILVTLNSKFLSTSFISKYSRFF